MYKKTIEEMNLIDDFLMSAAASDKEVGEKIMRCILTVLLQRKIGKVKVVSQSVIPGNTPLQRGIRMDVEITESREGEDDAIVNVYDLEPHTKRDLDFPRANRFRQAKIDSRYMKSGDDQFEHLPDLYVITITNFDIFNKDNMVYTFRTVCSEDSDIKYEDGIHRIYFNTQGKKCDSTAIRNMLNYIQNSNKNAAIDTATEELEGYVYKVKTDSEVRRSVMTFGDIIDREKRETAIETAKETFIETITDLLEDLGPVSEELNEKLNEIDDSILLKRVHKLAARVDSIEDFEEKLDQLLTK